MLTDRTAVITGGAQGIGFAIATRFAEHGAPDGDVGDLDETKAKEAAASAEGGRDRGGLWASPPIPMWLRCSMPPPSISDPCERHGRRRRHHPRRHPCTRCPSGISTTSSPFTCVAAGTAPDAPRALVHELGGRSIINMSSISGKVGFVGADTNYSAAKASMVGLSKAAAKEVAHLGVRINVIPPGLIRTAMTEAMPQGVWDQKLA